MSSWIVRWRRSDAGMESALSAMASASGAQAYTNFPDPESRGDFRNWSSAAPSAIDSPSRSNRVAICLLGGHRSSEAICYGTCRKVARRVIDGGILNSRQAGEGAPRVIKAKALAEIERTSRPAGTFKSTPTNAAILTPWGGMHEVAASSTTVPISLAWSRRRRAGSNRLV